MILQSWIQDGSKRKRLLSRMIKNGRTIYYGNGYYGIGEASIGYFNKKPNELTISEASILAGLPNAPSAYSLTEHKDLAIKRQKQVLEAMAKYKYIKEKEIDEIIKED